MYLQLFVKVKTMEFKLNNLILSTPNKNLSFYNKLHDTYRYWKSLNSNGKDIC